MKRHCVFLTLILTTALILTSPVAALEAMSNSINVLALPVPTIESIDPQTGIVSLQAPDLDLDIPADFRAVVHLWDANLENQLDSAEVKISDPGNIKVPLNVKVEKGNRVFAVLINYDMRSENATDTADTKWNLPSPSAPGGYGDYDGGSAYYEYTEYVVTESTPEKIYIDKIIEKPVPQPVSILPADNSVDNTIENIETLPTAPEMESKPMQKQAVESSPKAPKKTSISFILVLVVLGLVICAFCVGYLLSRLVLIRRMGAFEQVSATMVKDFDNEDINILASSEEQHIYSLDSKRQNKGFASIFSSIINKSIPKKQELAVPCLASLTGYFDTYGVTFDSEPDKLPPNILSIFNQYQLVYDNYKRQKQIQEAL